MITKGISKENPAVITAVYFLGFIVLGLVTGTHGPAIPVFAEQTGVSLGTISIVFSAISAGHLVGSFISSRLYDAVQGHKIMTYALVLMAICLYGSALTQALTVLIFLSFGVGLAKSAINVGCNTLMVWLHDKSVAHYMNALHFSFGFGAFLGPVLVTYSLTHHGIISWGFGILATLSLVVALGCFNLKSPAPLIVKDQSKAQPSAPYAYLLIIFIFLYVGTEVSFGGWIFTYADESGIKSTNVKGYLASSFWGALTLARLVFIPVVARVKPQVVLLGSLVFCMVSILVMLQSHALVYTFIGTIGMGMGLASIFPTVIVLAQNQHSITGRIMGNLSMGASLGAMAIPWIVGQLIVSTGPVVFLWFTLSTICLAIVVLMMHSLKHNKFNYSKPA